MIITITTQFVPAPLTTTFDLRHPIVVVVVVGGAIMKTVSMKFDEFFMKFTGYEENIL